MSSAADAVVWLKKSFSSALFVFAVVAEVEDDAEVAETKAAKSLLQKNARYRRNTLVK